MNRVLRAYLVGDSPATNDHLARALTETGRVELAGSATLPVVALTEIPARAVDVLFFDLQMLRLDGGELLERLPVNPHVVLVTGHDEQDAIRTLEQRCAICHDPGEAKAPEPDARRDRSATGRL
jgi:DNA-binding NarL/FixJ family response regulator